MRSFKLAQKQIAFWVLILLFIFSACKKELRVQKTADLEKQAKQALEASCGTVLDLEKIQSLNPERYARYLRMESNLKEQKGSKRTLSVDPARTIYIPVVVHVLHNGEPVGVGANLSYDQIQNQIAVLNEDFRRYNADKVNTPSAFAGVAADCQIEFYLSCKNPSGNSTDGVDRVQTSLNSFSIAYNADNSINEPATKIKFSSLGGADAWAPERYLNMWVCNIASNNGNQTLGYAQFPLDFDTKRSTDGVVIFNQSFGRGFVNNWSQYNGGRVATHEVGHWLNLYHIFGKYGGGCSDSDECDDTPSQAGISRQPFGCPNFPLISCNNGPNGNMFMNYMDYSYDDCQNMFSTGQKGRMWSTFQAGQPRATFATQDPPVNDGSIKIVANPYAPDGDSVCPYYWYHFSIPFNNVQTQWNVVNGAITYTYSPTHIMVAFDHRLVEQNTASIGVTVLDPCSGEPFYYELSYSYAGGCDAPETLRKQLTPSAIAPKKL